MLHGQYEAVFLWLSKCFMCPELILRDRWDKSGAGNHIQYRMIGNGTMECRELVEITTQTRR